ncbi:conserved protein of unknown function [Rhodovastum atsumiense]|uniref:Glycosyltransferase family 2 protein n=1 Tax=Rhodovastum atsumiense TaxID=504468 RepID=A0A5M6J102_9PROT|nr:hypothetical protein [Rhodovastum atsumiense]KAA5613879.1 hypothetical protein F1189_03645 [Rhodovastum atsumiense]CAH2602003.1 conserved protein of unknown function [Rhodovastum atsumiense]
MERNQTATRQEEIQTPAAPALPRILTAPLPRVAGRPRWCVFTSAGDYNNVAAWMEAGQMGRRWDLVTAFYGEDDSAYAWLASRSTLCVRSKGSKFQNLKKLHSADPELLRRYDFVLVADDDLIWQSSQDIDRLFEIASQQDFWVCQPAFSPAGRVSHKITAWTGQRNSIRHVNFIEVTCPVFRSDKLAAFLDIYDGKLLGWGIDWWFCTVLDITTHRKAAIIDKVVVTNPHDHQRRGKGREILKLQSDEERCRHWQEVMRQHDIAQYEHRVFARIIDENPRWNRRLDRLRRALRGAPL